MIRILYPPPGPAEPGLSPRSAYQFEPPAHHRRLVTGMELHK